MARPLRIEYEGAFYHVINRGVEKRVIFAKREDYTKFLTLLSLLKVRHGVEVLAYCILPNHFHLFVRTLRGGLGRFMHELLGRYALYFNNRYERVGPLFQGRYRALIVDGEIYAAAVARYIHLNPVKAKICSSPVEYQWSSCRVYSGKTDGGITDVDFLTNMLGGSIRERAGKFMKYTLQGLESEGYDPNRDAVGGFVVGGETFVSMLKKGKIPRKLDTTIARLKELQIPPGRLLDLMRKRAEHVTDDDKLKLKMVVMGLKVSTPLGLKTIARMVGMKSLCAVSKCVSRLENERQENPELDKILKRFEGMCRVIK